MAVNASDYGVGYNTGGGSSGTFSMTRYFDPRTGRYDLNTPYSGTVKTNSSGGVTSTFTGSPMERQLTPQEQMQGPYQSQIQSYMRGDPTGGYGDKLKQLMGGQFNATDPSYQWRFAQGQQAVERSAASQGLLDSGNAAIALQQYGQGAASQEYGAQFNRTLQAMQASEGSFQAGYTRLAELAGLTPQQQIAASNLNLGYNQLAGQTQYQQGLLGLESQRIGLANQQQQFNQQSQQNTDDAFKQFLSQMTNPYASAGGGNVDLSSLGVGEMSGYTPPSYDPNATGNTTSDFMGASSGSGSFVSSSGGSGTFGQGGGDLYTYGTDTGY